MCLYSIVFPSAHYSTLASERDALEALKTSCQRQLQASREKTDQDNSKVC